MENENCIGPFQLLEPLGKGGMGVVYKARHRDSGQVVALKTIRAVHEMQLESIRREIRTLARINHPGIVHILSEGVHDGLPWYAMELLSGITLRQHFFPPKKEPQNPAQDNNTQATFKFRVGHEKSTDSKRSHHWWTSSLLGLKKNDEKLSTGSMGGEGSTGNQPSSSSYKFDTAPPLDRSSDRQKQPSVSVEIAQILSIVRRICAPLAFLHGEGIVHRDLKPENIIIQENDLPVLVDFGLMAWFGGERSRETLVIEKGGAGTINYMAPEQIKGAFVDARADLYALGCILYELLTGKSPFMSKNFSRVMKGHLYAAPPPPSHLRPEIPLELDELVLRLLAKNPRQRLGHADVVATFLAQLAHEDVTVQMGPNPRAYLYRSGFVSRIEHLKELKNHGDRLLNGQGGLVFVGGESGVGKTRLVMEFGFAAAKQNIMVLTGECARMSGRSLEAFQRPLRIIGDRCRQMGPEITDTLLGRRGKILALYEPSLSDLPGLENYPDPVDLPVYSARMRLFSYLADTFNALSKEAPVLLVIDDLQWADELVLEFFEYVLRTGHLQRFPILIVATYRSEDLNEELKKIVEASTAGSMILNRLDEESISMIVSDMLAMAEAPHSLCKYLITHSEGNPFFVVEYLRAAVEEGFLYRDEQGNWKLDIESEDEPTLEEKYGSIPLPSSLQGLIERRLMSLPELAKKLIKAAAVLGLEAKILLLWEMTNIDDQELLDVIEELLQRQILKESTPGTVRFFHAKIREVALSRIESEEQRRLHLVAANCIERLFSSQRKSYLVELAHHREKAGELDQARSCYYAAARRAKEQYDHRNAERFYGAYLKLVEDPTAESITARIELASEVLHVLGRNQEALTQLETAREEARSLDDHSAEAECLYLMGTIHSPTGRGDLARQLFEKALLIAQEVEDAKIEGRTRGHLARLHYDHGRLDEAQTLYEQAIEIARSTGDRQIEGRILHDLARLQHDRGLMEQARELNEKALAIAREENDRRGMGLSLSNLAFLYHGLGNLSHASELYEQALAIARAVDDKRLEGHILGNLGNLYKTKGRLEEAEQHYEQALSIAREMSDLQSEARTLGNLAAFYQDHDRLDKARKLQEHTLTITRKANYRKGEGITLLNLALIYYDQGQLDTAGQFFEQALTIVREVGDRRIEGYTLGAQAELQRELDSPDQARKLYDQALAIANTLHDRNNQAETLANLGRFQFEQGYPQEALQLYQQALEKSRQGSNKLIEGVVLHRLAIWERRINGDLDAAEKYATAASQILEKLRYLKNLALIRSEQGHLALARSRSAQSFILQVQILIGKLAVDPVSEIGMALTRLERAQTAFETKENQSLFHGEVIHDIPDGLHNYLVNANLL
ncbi:tetratricopeptide repeat protein [candidate division CSSED10-310 bacterium]|uniref:Tetratricopeptide repeat protein n=1 Tax=candidate division CSSED10-310 bacterium TaxID=2855610 RepID=A0ABV6YWV9_UNCC1